MSRRILFLCPHNAAKSVLAAAHCNQLAALAGLDLVGTCAGTEPDAQVLPVVEQMLRDEGVDISGYTPQRVTPADLQSAWRVVSLGCDSTDPVLQGITIIQWDEIPPVSQNPLVAREAIRARVKQLVDDVASEQNAHFR